MNYRPEIDGLRALAVLPVIFFHAGFAGFEGGYVGVDVFYVISGYLITTIIANDLGAGKFSIIEFYERRARRILPALFFMMAISVPLSWLLLLPEDFTKFSHSLIAVPTFMSNVLFWRESGYFDGAAELKPLLHTWSLAVEEQFYVIFPLLLILMWRMPRRRIQVGIVALCLASLALSEYAVARIPAAAFFLLPTRAWELGMGSLLALSTVPQLASQRFLKEVLGATGLVMIGISVALFDEYTPFPSAYTLVPTAGALLLIAFAQPPTLAGRLLGSRLFVGVGLLSYSAYLWHQPLFAFTRHATAEGEPRQIVLACLAVTSIVIAYLSWRFVEGPFRSRTFVGRSGIFMLAGVASATFVLVGLFGHFLNGAAFRFSPAQQQLLAVGDYKKTMVAYGLRTCFADYDQGVETLVKNGCVTPGPVKRARLIVFGDSEAAHLIAGARAEYSASYQIEQWTATSCRAIAPGEINVRCAQFFRSFVADVLPHLSERDVVLVSSNWVGALKSLSQMQFAEALGNSFSQLARTRAKIWVVGDTPEFEKNPLHTLVRRGDLLDEPAYVRSLDYRKSSSQVAAASQSLGFIFYDPAAVLCKSASPLECLVHNGREPIFVDGGHLAPAGSALLMSAIHEQQSPTP